METKTETEAASGVDGADPASTGTGLSDDAGLPPANKSERPAKKADASGGKAAAKRSPEKKKTGAWAKLGGGKKKTGKRKDEAKALQDRMLRLQADFENFRKRMLREKNELFRTANEDLMLELLPVLDHVDFALGAAEQHGADPAFMEGFKLVGEQLRSALGKFGLKAIEAEGMAFDPNCHEAISQLPSKDVPEGGIMAVARRGYTLGDQHVLRAAQVVVSSGGPGEDGAESAGANDTESSTEA